MPARGEIFRVSRQGTDRVAVVGPFPHRPSGTSKEIPPLRAGPDLANDPVRGVGNFPLGK
jgi:hypothetical protein